MKRRDEVAVGMLVTVALIVVVIGSLWLARGGLSRGYPLYTRFTWGQNLKQGQSVLLAGVTVGYVDDVELDDRRGFIRVGLRIEDDKLIPRGSVATVKPVGIFGDVAVALTPPDTMGEASYAPGDTIPAGAGATDMAVIIGRVDTLGVAVARIVAAVEQDLIAAGALKDLRRVVASTATFAAQMQSVLAEQNRNATATMASFRNTADRFGALADSAMVDSVMANVRTTSANFARITAQFDSTSRSLRQIVDRINAGEGNVGKLANDSTLYLNSQRLIARFDSLLADLMKNPKKYISVSIFGR